MPGIPHIYPQGLAELATNGAKLPLGTIRRHGAKTYKYVKFVKGTGSVAVAVNNCVYYNSTAMDTVTADLTDVIGTAAGISQVAVTTAQMDAANGAHGWIQIKGVSSITPNVTAGAVGNAMTHIGTTDGTLDVSALVTDPIVATLLDATGGANLISCDFPY